MIISKTPLRVSFAGGGTDLPSFYRSNGYGAVLSTSINQYIYVTVKNHTDFFDERFRLNYSETEMVDNLDDIRNPIIRECLRFLEIDEKIYISTIADVAGSSGLGSSSSFCVGLLNALHKYRGRAVSAGRLAEEAGHVEIDILKRPIGRQDHYAAAFGGLNYIRFADDESVTIKPIIPSDETLSRLFDSMISFWTRITRPAESILQEQDGRSTQNAEHLIQLREQSEQVMELLYREDFPIEELGRILHEGWQLKRGLASKVSNPEIDRSYRIARDLGAIGGKISGAGGGGFLNIIAHQADRKAIAEALEATGMLACKFNMDSAGTTVTQVD